MEPTTPVNPSVPPVVPVAPVAPAPAAPASELPSLTPEQTAFINRASFGAFGTGMLYFFAAGMPGQGFAFFIPFYNIFVWIRGIVKGRRMSWERGEWKNFEVYHKRQKYMDKAAVVLVIVFAAYFALMIFVVAGSFSLSASRDRANDAEVQGYVSNMIPAAMLQSNGTNSYAGITAASLNTGFSLPPCSGAPILNISPDGTRLAAFAKSCMDHTQYYCAVTTAGPSTNPNGTKVSVEYAMSGATVCSPSETTAVSSDATATPSGDDSSQ